MQDDSKKKKRGRPKNYDRDLALSAILNLFWTKGYAATSLDELAGVTGMARPSLYNAFGDKHEMYMQAFDFFVSGISTRAKKALQSSEDLQEALLQFYISILDVYFGKSTDLGCLVFCTAVAETNNNPEIKAALSNVISQLDQALKTRFQLAKEIGQLNALADVEALATLAQALLQHISIRARAGEQKERLLELVNSAVLVLTK